MTAVVRWCGRLELIDEIGFLGDSQLDKGPFLSPRFLEVLGWCVLFIFSSNPHYPFRQDDYLCACCKIPCSSCRSSFQFSDLENVKPAWQQADIKRKDICWRSICYFVFQLAHANPRWRILCLWLDEHGDRRRFLILGWQTDSKFGAISRLVCFSNVFWVNLRLLWPCKERCKRSAGLWALQVCLAHPAVTEMFSPTCGTKPLSSLAAKPLHSAPVTLLTWKKLPGKMILDMKKPRKCVAWGISIRCACQIATPISPLLMVPLALMIFENTIFEVWNLKNMECTVDGWNPAPVDR